MEITSGDAVPLRPGRAEVALQDGRLGVAGGCGVAVERRGAQLRLQDGDGVVERDRLAVELGDPFIASADGHYVIFGDIEDVTVDPSKAVMAKINLKGEPSRGPDAAKVTVVEFSDFQCPFCSRGYNTMEQQVLKQYVDKVKFYYKHYPLPFHPWAQAGAVATECAKQQKPDACWTLYKGLFEQQKDITADNLKDKAHAILADAKIDQAKFDDCLDNKKTLDKVKADMAEGSSVGVTGTPSFVVNGRLLVGAQPFEAFKNVIDDELASAK